MIKYEGISKVEIDGEVFVNVQDKDHYFGVHHNGNESSDGGPLSEEEYRRLGIQPPFGELEWMKLD